MLKRLGPVIIPLSGIFLLGLLYLLSFPIHVQSGDTGELVANAYHLRVVHPPGYPLFTILYHAFLKTFSLSSVFGNASILTIFLSLAWVGLLLHRFRSLMALLCVLVTGTSLVFWRYAILPDVFALHLVFLTMVFLVFDRPENLKKPWMIFLIGLSIAHHHTILFVFPMFACALLQDRSRWKFAWAMLSAAFSFGLYFLLFTFHPDDFLSWGEINSVSGLVKHFLRSEYGTFSLSIWKEKNYSWILYSIEQVLKNFWSLILLSGLLIRHHQKNLYSWKQKEILIVVGVVAYFMMFAMAGAISLNSAGQGVFERFLLQPILLLVFLLLLTSRSFPVPKYVMVAMALNVLMNAGLNWNANNYRNRSDVEDYSINALRSLPAKSIYHAHGDAESFSAYYVRDVLNVRQDVILLPSIGLLSWAETKLSRHYPEAYKNTGPTLLEKQNLDQFNFYSNKLFPLILKGVSVVHFGLLYEYSKKKSAEKYRCSIAETYVWRNPPTLLDLNYFDYGHLLFLNNETCYLAKGVDAMRSRDFEGAKASFEKGISLVPLSVRIQDGLCRVYQELNDSRAGDCSKRLEALIESENQQYYLHKF